MPWYCGQPFGKPLDLSLGEDEIKRLTIEDHRDNPRFRPIETWRQEADAEMGGGGRA